MLHRGVRALDVVVSVWVVLCLDPPVLVVAAGSLALRTASLRESGSTQRLLLLL